MCLQAGYSKLLQQPGRDQTIVTGAGGPSGTGKRPTGDTILPPPVFVQDLVVAERNSKSRNSSGTIGGSQANGSASVGEGGTDEDSISSPVVAASTSVQGDSAGTAASQSGPSQRQGQSTSAAKKGGDGKGNVAVAPTVSSTSQPGNRVAGPGAPSQKGVAGGSKSSGEDTQEQSVQSASASQVQKDTKGGAKPQRNGSDRNISNSSKSSGVGTEAESLGAHASESASGATAVESTGKSVPEVNPKKSQGGMGASGGPAPAEGGQTQTAPSLTPSPTLRIGTPASASISNLVSSSSFNGLGNCAVFPVPISSLTVSIWSNLLAGSSDDLTMNPYALITVPVTELFELTIPPVDAACMAVWPKPLSHYSQGVGADGVTSGPAGQHTFHRSYSSQQLPPTETATPSVGAKTPPSASVPTAGSSSAGASAMNQKEGPAQTNPGLSQYHQQQQQQQQQQQTGSYINAGSARGPTGNGVPPPAQAGQTQQPTIAALQQMFPGVHMAFGTPKTGQQQSGYNTSATQR